MEWERDEMAGHGRERDREWRAETKGRKERNREERLDEGGEEIPRMPAIELLHEVGNEAAERNEDESVIIRSIKGDGDGFRILLLRDGGMAVSGAVGVILVHESGRHCDSNTHAQVTNLTIQREINGKSEKL